MNGNSIFDRSGEARATTGRVRLSPVRRDAIGRLLRKAFDEPGREEVPRDMVELLQQIA